MPGVEVRQVTIRLHPHRVGSVTKRGRSNSCAGEQPPSPPPHLGAVFLEKEAGDDGDVERERVLLLAGLLEGQLVRLRLRVVLSGGGHLGRTGLTAPRE